MSDKATLNYYRLITLVVKSGTKTLAKVFTKSISGGVSVDTLLKQKQTKTQIQKLHKACILSEPQFQLLNKDNPDINTFDISLLAILLQNFTTIEAPQSDWRTKSVPTSDRSIGGYIIRMRNVRNEVVGHKADVKITDSQFTKHWKEVERCLEGLAADVSPAFKDDVLKEIGEISRIEIAGDSNSELEASKLEATLKKWHVEELYAELAGLNDKMETHTRDMKKVLDSVSSIERQLGGGNQRQPAATNQAGEQIGMTMNTQINQVFQTMNINYAGILQQMGIPTTNQPMETDLPPIDHRHPGALSERDIVDYAKELGGDWGTFAVFLGYKQPQIDKMKSVYPHAIDALLRTMIQKWHDVVVRCEGENPKMLLAAAFSCNKDNKTALMILNQDKEKLKEVKKLRPKADTEAKIQDISFDIPNAARTNVFILGVPFPAIDFPRQGNRGARQISQPDGRQLGQSDSMVPM